MVEGGQCEGQCGAVQDSVVVPGVPRQRPLASSAPLALHASGPRGSSGIFIQHSKGVH